MLSILIPLYNRNVFQLVETLHKQALRIHDFDFEILVCDDASVNKYAKNDAINSLKNCTLFTLDMNIGRTGVRNILAQKAKYNHLLFLDADVLPGNPNFLLNYIKSMDNSVIFGGYEYIKDRKICAQNLRYKFGVSREAVPLNKRIKEPYRFTFSGNFLIPRNIFLTLNISDQNQYGMDLLFSSLLMKNQIQIKHINNPIYHIGLEENQVFVKKSISAVTYRFSLRNEIHYELERKHKLISKCYLDRAILLCYKTFKSKIEKNLTSTRPNLLLYDFYRLGHYISLHKG